MINIAEKQGFKIKITLKKPEGVNSYYIVHLGQRHHATAGTFIDRHASNKRINNFQQQFYPLVVQAFKSSGGMPVLREGFAHNDADLNGEKLRMLNDFMMSTYKWLSEQLKKPFDSMRSEELIQILETMYAIYNESKEDKPALKYMLRHPDYPKVMSRFVELLNKLSKFRNKDRVIDEFVTFFGFQILGKRIDASFGHRFVAASEAYYKGEIKTLGAERFEVNRRAIELLKDLDSLKSEIIKLENQLADAWLETKDGQEYKRLKGLLRSSVEGGMSEERKQLVQEFANLLESRRGYVKKHLRASKLFKRFQLLSKKTEKAIHDDRETVVYEKIVAFFRKHPDWMSARKIKFIPVIYGMAHTFADSARIWNATHADIKFGIIEIKPKK